MMAVDISLSPELEDVKICSCSARDSEENAPKNPNFTFTEWLLLEYCCDKSIRKANTFVQQCIQYRSGKPVPLSYQFFCYLVMQETKMSHQKLKLFSQFKNADRQLWTRRGTYVRERTAESRSHSLDYLNPEIEEFMWCERVDILELVSYNQLLQGNIDEKIRGENRVLPRVSERKKLNCFGLKADSFKTKCSTQRQTLALNKQNL